jgi:phage replication-related protein YjqB (UPF0714/DUF867 family)
MRIYKVVIITGSLPNLKFETVRGGLERKDADALVQKLREEGKSASITTDDADTHPLHRTL